MLCIGNCGIKGFQKHVKAAGFGTGAIQFAHAFKFAKKNAGVLRKYSHLIAFSFSIIVL